KLTAIDEARTPPDPWPWEAGAQQFTSTTQTKSFETAWFNIAVDVSSAPNATTRTYLGGADRSMQDRGAVPPCRPLRPPVSMPISRPGVRPTGGPRDSNVPRG